MLRQALQLRWIAIIAAAALFSGCGKGPKIVRVTGTVTHAGKPVPHMFLTFIPEKGKPSFAETDDDGRFTISHDQGAEGATTGVHTVNVQYRPRDPNEEAAIASGKLKLPRFQKEILEKYGNRKVTPLKVEINQQDQVLDIRLD